MRVLQHPQNVSVYPSFGLSCQYSGIGWNSHAFDWPHTLTPHLCFLTLRQYVKIKIQYLSHVSLNQKSHWWLIPSACGEAASV